MADLDIYDATNYKPYLSKEDMQSAINELETAKDTFSMADLYQRTRVLQRNLIESENSSDLMEKLPWLKNVS